CAARAGADGGADRARRRADPGLHRAGGGLHQPGRLLPRAGARGGGADACGAALRLPLRLRAADGMSEPGAGGIIDVVTVVVTRKVKAGRAADYEAWLKGVTQVVARWPGFLGISVFKPANTEAPYTFVYKFDSGDHLDAWLNSSERKA